MKLSWHSSRVLPNGVIVGVAKDKTIILRATLMAQPTSAQVNSSSRVGDESVKLSGGKGSLFLPDSRQCCNNVSVGFPRPEILFASKGSYMLWPRWRHVLVKGDFDVVCAGPLHRSAHHRALALLPSFLSRDLTRVLAHPIVVDMENPCSPGMLPELFRCSLEEIPRTQYAAIEASRCIQFLHVVAIP